jgi:hypothetical protein
MKVESNHKVHKRPEVICRHIVCQHRVEVEVSPATAEVCFQHERFAHPFNTMVQFQAFVYNAPSNRVTWHVLDVDGGPGAGTIDAAGLYIAPIKVGSRYSLTDVVVATSVDDPFRRAFARVAVIGMGPEHAPVARLQVFPHRVHLYYPEDSNNSHNSYIDTSNTMQLFRALVRHADPALVQWSVNPPPPPPPTMPTGSEFLYKVTGANPSAERTVKINAWIPGSPAAADWATVSLLNYYWPGIT